ncbi:MAG: hypothetical protein HC867_06935 [Bacteroidia bacterium]|nr:hypothetical protein [Bacteroidia bacterium]
MKNIVRKSEINVENSTATEQWRTTNTVSTGIVESIKVYVDYGLVTSYSNWDMPIRFAMQHWANANNSKVNFYMLNSNPSYDENNFADIAIMPDNGSLSNGGIAAATFPTVTGSPGWQIIVNTDFHSTSPGNTVSEANRFSNKVWAIVHEIGHCLGFRHSNWQAAGESIAPDGAIQISSTPSYRS